MLPWCLKEVGSAAHGGPCDQSRYSRPAEKIQISRCPYCLADCLSMYEGIREFYPGCSTVVCLSERHKHASLIWLISASTLCKSELMRFRHRVRFALQPAIWKVAGSIVYWYSKLPATEGSMGSFSGRQCATNKPNSLLSSRSHGHWPGNIAKHRVHGPTCASHWVYTEVQSC